MPTTSPTSKFYRDTLQDSSGESWDEIAELNSVSFPDKSREVIDCTHLNVANLYRVFKFGFRDAGRVVFNFNFTAAQYEKLNADFNRNTSVFYKIVLPDSGSSEFVFEGGITRLGGPGAQPGSSNISCDCEIKLTGQPESEPS